MLTLYSKQNCPNCVQAKNILDMKNIPYETVMVDVDDPAGYAGRTLLADDGHRSVPQIYKEGKLFVVGGHFGLRRMMLEGKLVA